MKRKRFTKERIIGVLREHELGAKTADLPQARDQRSDLLQLEEQSSAAWTSPKRGG
jgi:hypothetical protein